MSDKDKKKFRITQNVIIIVYRGDAEEIDLEEEKAKLLKLLSKT